MDQIIKKWAKAILNIVKVNIKVHNPHQVSLQPGQPYIFMSNHNSLYDIPLIFEVLPNSGYIRMIAKKELFSVPIWGRAMRASGFMSIDRKNPIQAKKDLENVLEKMKQGIIVWIAPEGTRSLNGELGPFKKGAFMLAIQMKATIIPIVIKGAANILPPKKLNFQLNQKVELTIGKPIQTADYTIEKRMYLLKEVRQSINQMLVDNAPINPTTDNQKQD